MSSEEWADGAADISDDSDFYGRLQSNEFLSLDTVHLIPSF